MRVAALLIALAIFGSETKADEIRLVLQDGNTLSAPILEFRARGGTFPSGAGHAFVLLGTMSMDGLATFHVAGGFYPKDAALAPGPGEVTFRLEDTKSDEVFRVHISRSQDIRVKTIFSAWNAKQYGADWQNFAVLAHDVGRTLGLAGPDVSPDSVNEDFPAAYVAILRSLNDSHTPLKQEVQAEAAREAARRAQERADDDRRADQREADRRALQRAEDDRRALQRELDRREEERRRR